MRLVDETKPDDLSVEFAALKAGDVFIFPAFTGVFVKRPAKLGYPNARRLEDSESVNFDGDCKVTKVEVTAIHYKRVKA